MPGGYVEDFAGNVPEEGSDLRRCNEPSRACDGVPIHGHGMVAGCTEALRSADDVQSGLCQAHPAAAGTAPVSECLTIVIVFLFAKAKVREGDVAVRNRGEVVKSAASGGREGKIAHDDWQCRQAIAPVWAVDRGEGIGMVAAPF